MVDKLALDGGMVGVGESRLKINEIIDDAGGDFSGGGGGGGSAYSTGWATSHGSVTVAQGSTHTITHNLGTTDVIAQVYVNSSASDTNAQNIDSSLEHDEGCSITSLTSNTLVLQLGGSGYGDMNGSGSGIGTTFASKYLKVVVSAGGGGSASSTFDDDAPTSPSTGDTWWDNGEGKMYIYSGTHWVQTNATGGGSARGGGSYDTGWTTSLGGTTVANSTEYTITHNLGCGVGCSVDIYVADDAAGTDAVRLEYWLDSLNAVSGAQAYSFAENSLLVQSRTRYIDMNGTGSGGTGSLTAFTGKYMRVVVQATGNPIQYSSGWVTTDGTTTVANGATLTVPHNLGTTDVIVATYVNSSASDTNAQCVSGMIENAAGWDGTEVTSLTSNTLELQLSQDGYLDVSGSGAGSTTAFTSKYIKVVVSASVSSDSGGKVKASIIFDGNSGSIGTGTHNLNVTSITDNGTGDYDVNLAITIIEPLLSLQAADPTSLGKEFKVNCISFSPSSAAATSFNVTCGRGSIIMEDSVIHVLVF